MHRRTPETLTTLPQELIRHITWKYLTIFDVVKLMKTNKSLHNGFISKEGKILQTKIIEDEIWKKIQILCPLILVNYKNVFDILFKNLNLNERQTIFLILTKLSIYHHDYKTLQRKKANNVVIYNFRKDNKKDLIKLITPLLKTHGICKEQLIFSEYKYYLSSESEQKLEKQNFILHFLAHIINNLFQADYKDEYLYQALHAVNGNEILILQDLAKKVLIKYDHNIPWHSASHKFLQTSIDNFLINSFNLENLVLDASESSFLINLFFNYAPKKLLTVLPVLLNEYNYNISRMRTDLEDKIDFMINNMPNWLNYYSFKQITRLAKDTLITLNFLSNENHLVLADHISRTCNYDFFDKLDGILMHTNNESMLTYENTGRFLNYLITNGGLERVLEMRNLKDYIEMIDESDNQAQILEILQKYSFQQLSLIPKDIISHFFNSTVSNSIYNDPLNLFYQKIYLQIWPHYAGVEFPEEIKDKLIEYKPNLSDWSHDELVDFSKDINSLDIRFGEVLSYTHVWHLRKSIIENKNTNQVTQPVINFINNLKSRVLLKHFYEESGIFYSIPLVEGFNCLNLLATSMINDKSLIEYLDVNESLIKAILDYKLIEFSTIEDINGIVKGHLLINDYFKDLINYKVYDYLKNKPDMITLVMDYIFSDHPDLKLHKIKTVLQAVDSSPNKELLQHLDPIIILIAAKDDEVLNKILKLSAYRNPLEFISFFNQIIQEAKNKIESAPIQSCFSPTKISSNPHSFTYRMKRSFNTVVDGDQDIYPWKHRKVL